MITYKRTNAANSDFAILIALLDQYLAIMDGDEHSFYAQYNLVANIPHVIVCYSNQTPIGCGAFKPYSPHAVEIKRMFVMPSHRGQGIGHQILQQLEMWAAQCNYQACILETGKGQKEAIHLYQKAGYTITSNYGQYQNIANSVCMAKAILK